MPKITEHSRLPRNFHKTFKPERHYLNAMLRYAASGQEGGKQLLLDVAVAYPLLPITEKAIAQIIAEEGNDAVLRGALGLADTAHVIPSPA